MPSLCSSQPCFRIIQRSGRGIFGSERWVFALLSLFLCVKNNIKYINLTCGGPSTQASGPKPPTTDRICRVGLIRGVSGWGRWVVGSEMPVCVYFLVRNVNLNITTRSALLPRRQVVSIHSQPIESTSFSLFEVRGVTGGEGHGKYFICNTSYLSQKMSSNTNIPFTAQRYSKVKDLELERWFLSKGHGSNKWWVYYLILCFHLQIKTHYLNLLLFTLIIAIRRPSLCCIGIELVSS
jgi:hypothetical protein